jgi:hypothetical protein
MWKSSTVRAGEPWYEIQARVGSLRSRIVLRSWIPAGLQLVRGDRLLERPTRQCLLHLVELTQKPMQEQMRTR